MDMQKDNGCFKNAYDRYWETAHMYFTGCELTSLFLIAAFSLKYVCITKEINPNPF